MKVESLVMRALFIIVVVFAGCTRPNPNRCCSDEADCNAKGIPVGSMCEQGLVCRGNQCIAQPCTSSAQCDAAAPYCIAELCAEECADDAQCPGAGQTADAMFCVAGDCVSCREASDCNTNSPVCDAGACRACTSHDECGSKVCDAGQCVAETSIAYASPNGSTTSGCTIQQPCTLERSVAVADATRNVIKLLPGTYPPPNSGNWNIGGGYQLTMYGPATLQGGISVLWTASATPHLRVRNVSTTSWFSCNGQNAVVNYPSLELDRVAADYSNVPDQGNNVVVNADRCKLTVRDSALRVTDQYSGAIQVTGGGGSNGQLAIIERSLVQVREGLTNSAPAIQVQDFASLQITNSVIRGGSPLLGAIAFGTNVTSSSIKFTTFYNMFVKCPTGIPVVTSENNIFLNELNGAAADTVTGPGCTHRYVISKPQAAALAGANNIPTLDPRFVNAAGGDFHLMAGSPAIDAADPAATEEVDFDGTHRPQGAARDVGAFESK